MFYGEKSNLPQAIYQTFCLVDTLAYIVELLVPSGIRPEPFKCAQILAILDHLVRLALHDVLHHFTKMRYLLIRLRLFSVGTLLFFLQVVGKSEKWRLLASLIAPRLIHALLFLQIAISPAAATSII